MQDFLTQLYNLVLFPLILTVGGFMIVFINTKTQELKNKTKNEKEQKYIERIGGIINACVLTTNQTYVETLKKQGKFDAEAQKQAFETTKTAVLGMLNVELQDFITKAFGDINEYLTTAIEASVSSNKANS
jgi:hypothetical protein